ncbi:FAD-dependent oxidoreductase [Aquiflexum sp. LQ15W]|uniref:FAD-dependent oxidoreductase n=1 Tax=Cognataquiflexum nitidum TaxID=2922272 RepID=UPI001F12DF6A|nr:FAD-dependent oxidoreductase [Cognataquiflexum nitidum]MCH6201565.1 FAD-dependent oxidoreductase [Cognataquiflexum nitidum]
MKKYFLVFSVLWLSILNGYSRGPLLESDSYDVVIYGANSAGIIAAYTAKNLGKSVILIEPSNHLGGLTTGGLGYTDIGNKYAVTGLSRDFYRNLGKHYGKLEQWIFEPSVAKSVFQGYLDKAGIKVHFGHQLIKVEKENGYIIEIELQNIADTPSSNLKVKGKMFIDATYEGDLMALAGVTYTVGREPNSQYGETYNGVQLMNGHQLPDGLDPFISKEDPNSGLLWGISDNDLKPDGTGDSKVQAYNFRICLTNDPANRIEITEPEGYDASMFELLVRLFEAQPGKNKINDYFIWSKMPNQKTDINNRGGFSTDMIGMNYEYPEADYQTRHEIVKNHEFYTKSLLYFYKTDPRVPKEVQDFIQDWGYPRDEYVENGHWSPQLYVREVRRMVGEYVMTEANCVGTEVVEDGIGMAAYTMDSHNIQRVVIEKDGKKMVKNEGNVEIGGFGPYPIAYRSLIPKKGEIKNLFVPAALSASHIAFGSIRMEPVFMVLAQSSAVAACMAIDKNIPSHEVNVRELQKILKEDPLSDGSTAEVLVDNDDYESVQIKGNWDRQSNGGYGPSFLKAMSKGTEENSVRFIPTIMEAGDYDAYIYFSRTNEATSLTKVMINDGASKKEIIVKEEDIRVEGQTSGEWFYLGQYVLSAGNAAFVEVSNKDADGIVVADAVLFIPKKVTPVEHKTP